MNGQVPAQVETGQATGIMYVPTDYEEDVYWVAVTAADLDIRGFDLTEDLARQLLSGDKLRLTSGGLEPCWVRNGTLSRGGMVFSS